MSETTVEFHIPITMNLWFSVMTEFLVKSIARNAGLADNWRLVLTVSLDSDLDSSSPEYAWLQDYPVEVRYVEQQLWDELHYFGTSLDILNYAFDADVVVFIDADTLVVGDLRELLDQVATEKCIYAYPAWNPPAVDIDELLAEKGVTSYESDVVYSGYGLAFLQPKYGPPYFNCGFVCMSLEMVRDHARTFAEDLLHAYQKSENFFSYQAALTVNILSNGYCYRCLDHRYNMGIISDSLLKSAKGLGPESTSIVQAAIRQTKDVRVYHYCNSSEFFNKKLTMGSLDSVRAYLAKTGLSGTEKDFQQHLKRLIA